MQLRYDDDFLEGAVFVRSNSRQQGPAAAQVRRFHREREKLYSILDPDERNTAFFQLHLEWFREWRLERLLLELLDEFALLRENLSTVAFHKARAQRDEGAELYVGPEHGRVAMVALRCERFERPDELASFLRHEFSHLHDMVDPVFGYSPQLHLPGQNPAQQRLTRERYRLLWDITIDGRLDARSRATVQERDGHRRGLHGAFSFWPEDKREEVFEWLWLNPNPQHEQLLAIAADPRGLKQTNQPAAGAPCPLCGFPTFHWADAASLSGKPLAAIQREFPAWTPEQGACRRCHEIYRLAEPALAV
jgi:hypothetical protein